jgi:arylsulfatase A-like enzyme
MPRSTAVLVVLIATGCTPERAPLSPSASGSADPSRAVRPNVLVVVTDDQSFASFPSRPPAMPWLQSQLRSDDHWLRFKNAVVSTPICCPSRASILTGRYARRTGVLGNEDGATLDETDTLATWLDGVGYTSALIGKYLNQYPWDRGAYVPPGWDRWLAKRNLDERTTYYDYDVVDETTPLHLGGGPEAYATDYLGAAALEFLHLAPADAPWFLYFAPSAPHAPWTPAPGDEAAFADLRLARPSPRSLNGVEGGAGWVRALPPIDGARLTELQEDRVAERRALLGVDRAIHALVDEIVRRGELDRTVIFFLSDNGYAYGEHRWAGKRCPYEECIRVPFAVRTPWAAARGAAADALVSNVDVAPTVAALAGVHPSAPIDGVSLARLLRGGPPPERPGVLLEWAGDADVPPWIGVRTARAVLIHSADGTVELYRLDRDPHQVRNVAGEPSAASLRARLEDLLAGFVAALPENGQVQG